jgi:L-rhamnose isomerase
MIRIGDNAFRNRTNGLTGRLIIMTLTLSAQIRVDFENTVAHADRAVRAFWITHVTVNAFIGNE